MLRDDAPDPEVYAKQVDTWRLEATGVSTRMFYTCDWVDPVKWDRWLYENYHAYRVAMRQALDDRLSVIAAFAERNRVPSNSAPHHPAWHNVEWQGRLNARFRERG